MRKITLLFLFLSTALIGYSQTTSSYCSTEVLHLNIAAETASAFNLTIENTGLNTMKITAAAADISFLDLIGAITNSPTKSAADASVGGEISITLTWPGTIPAENITIQHIQWRKAGPATWQINDATTLFTGVCAPTPTTEDTTLSNLTFDGGTVAGFGPGVLNYNIELPLGTIVVPTVVGTPAQSAPATAVTTAASSLPGSSTILVTAQDGTTSATYTINFTVALPAVGLPLDFSDPLQLFIADLSQGLANTVSIISEKLSIEGNGNDWDNAYINFTAPVDLSNDAANTITFQMESTTAADGVEHFHLIKMTGNPTIELSFSTIGKEVKTVILDYPAHAGDTYTEMRIFVDAGNGATKSAVETYLIDNISAPAAAPATCSDGIQNQDETGIDCGGAFCAPCDLTAPTAFTATAGAIGAFSVELLLNGTDASGTLTYDISYNGGANTTQTTGDSGVETSFIISGLTAETAYSFDISASDASANQAANNDITVTATTIVDTSTACIGFSSDAAEGSFSVGYNYSFVTSGTDLTINIGILDTDKADLVGQVFIPPSTFIDMTNTGSNNFTYTLADQVDASVVSFYGRFPYAGGLVRTKLFEYTVGDDCGSLSLNNIEIEGLKAYPNPTNYQWTISTKNQIINSIELYNVVGVKVLSLQLNTLSTSVDASNLAPGVYISKITTELGTVSQKLIRN
jgi:hypothetical protein